MIFPYKSRFKEDYTTGIDLKDERNGVISVNPLGHLGKGRRTPPQFQINDLTIGDILDLAYDKFKIVMDAEEFPVRELRNIQVPRLRGVTFTPLSTHKGTIFVDKSTLRISDTERIGRNEKLKPYLDSGSIVIDDRIEIEFVKDNSLKNQNTGFIDSVYVFQYS